MASVAKVMLLSGEGIKGLFVMPLLATMLGLLVGKEALFACTL